MKKVDVASSVLRHIQPGIVKRYRILVMLALSAVLLPSHSQAQLLGEKSALDVVNRLLMNLGGKDVWAKGRTVHIILKGHYAVEPAPWFEEFWIDLEDPRGRYEIRSGKNQRVIAWTLAGGWEQSGDSVVPHSEQRMNIEKNYWKREPNVIYHRLARGVPVTRIVLDTANTRLARLTVVDAASNDTLCWFSLNPMGEPVKWSTLFNNDLLEHVLGPLREFGTITLPEWGGTTGGVWRYSNYAADLSLFPPYVSFEPRRHR